MAIGTILAVAASLYGSLKSAQANQNIDADLQRRSSDLDSWYNREYNQNYLDTDEAKSTLKVLRNQVKEQMKKVDQGNAVRGASDEARVATADKLNQRYSDAVTRLAGHGTQYRDNIRREYQGLKMNLDNMNLQNLQNKSQNWSNYMGNAAASGQGISEAEGSGALDWKKLFAGDNTTSKAVTDWYNKKYGTNFN